MARPPLRDIPTDPPSQWTGTDVRLLRRHLRISQTTLAHLLSCYRETVSRWERAADQPIANGPIHRLLDILDSHPEAFGEGLCG